MPTIERYNLRGYKGSKTHEKPEEGSKCIMCGIKSFRNNLNKWGLCIMCRSKYQRCPKCKVLRLKRDYKNGLYCSVCTSRLWVELEQRERRIQEYIERKRELQEDD